MGKIFRTTSIDKKGNKQKELQNKIPLSTASGYYLDRHITVKEAILEWIREPYDLSELEEGVSGGIQNTSEISETQEALEKQLTKELFRYLKWEKTLRRNLEICEPKMFMMGEEYYQQNPDVILVDDAARTIETIRYRSGKATGMTRGLLSGKKLKKSAEFSELEKFYDLYADIQYVKQNIQDYSAVFSDGNPYTITANYYFLKKTTDRSGYFNPNFGTENNIIGLEEVCIYGNNTSSELDKLFAGYVEQATTVGFDCDKNNCRYCLYKALCNFTRANVKQEQYVTKKLALGTPSAEQQKIIDAALDLTQEQFIKVNAGAGTGKTFTMVYLIISLLKKGYDIKDIFISSFTNAGVTEIRQRIAGVAQAEGFSIQESDICSFTFDSFFYRCVSENYKMLGMVEMPKFLNGDVQKQYVEDLVKEYPVQDMDYSKLKINEKSDSQTSLVVDIVSRVFTLIQTYQIDVTDAESIADLQDKMKESGSMHISDVALADILKLFTKFEQRLQSENLITYSHLPGMMERLYAVKPDLYDLKYKYLIIDEFQDSNQYQVDTILRMSRQKDFQKMVVVGDDAQSIYAFRNTSPEFIINFQNYVKKPVKEMFLLTNFRSSGNIIDTANSIIDLNTVKIDKALIAAKAKGSPVELKTFHSKKNEREAIVSKIEKLINDGVEAERICVIDRLRAGLLDVGTRLTEKNIPWVSKVGQNLLENSKVKAALALCDAFYDPEITKNYFVYLVAKHNGKLDEMDNADIMEQINELRNTFRMMENLEFEDQQKVFHQLLDDLKKVEDDELYEYFLELLYEYKTLPEELEYSRIFKKYGNIMEKKLDQNYKGVTLVTAHSSKGLEWDYVFVVLSDFDSTFLHKTSTLERLEETRRLLFVAVTRAKEQLYITSNYILSGNEKEGYVYNQFLVEMHDILGLDYDPVDHEKEAKKKQKKEEALLKKEARKKIQASLLDF